MSREVEREFVATRPQSAFLSSQALIRGYGGAMGGGKSRALCEAAFMDAIDFPGMVTLICRQAHTSIIGTTKKTMTEQVLPAELRAHSRFRKKESGGEDWVELPNGSRFHFIGLDDPVRWFSSEIGRLLFDEAHEIAEQDVMQLITRLRQAGMPHRVDIAFNPGNPGHWLQKWFFDGAQPTRFGFAKEELFPTDADGSLGDCEFFFAKATDNPHLPVNYIQRRLASLPRALRRRYLEGIWEFIEGHCYFDLDALDHYRELLEAPQAVGVTKGGGQEPSPSEKVGVRPRKSGPLAVWRPPVRGDKPHRYVLSVDVSSGGAQDFSGLQVVDVEEFAQVAEWQGKLDPDLVAVEAFRLGRIYNEALIVPEITGGWGHTVVSKLEKLSYRRIYTRRVEDRLKKSWTDKLGWNTDARSRALMLDNLEEVLREKTFTLRGHRTFGELTTFVRDEKGRPAAQPGCNDDLVVALAIAVLMASTLPRQLRRPEEKRREPVLAATGWGA